MSEREIRTARCYTFTPNIFSQEFLDVLSTDANTLSPDANACRQALMRLRAAIRQANAGSDDKPRIGLDYVEIFVDPEIQGDDALARLDERVQRVLLDAAQEGVLFPEFGSSGLEVSKGSFVEVHEPFAHELTDDDRRVLLMFCHLVKSTEPEVFICRAAMNAAGTRAMRAMYRSVAGIADEFPTADEPDVLFTAAALEIKQLVEVLGDWPGFPKDRLPSSGVLMKLAVLLFEQCDFFDSIMQAKTDRHA